MSPEGCLGLAPPPWVTPFQGGVSSEHPLVVVSTAQVEDWEDSSSLLMERLLWALSLASTDLISVDRRVSTPLC